MQVMRTWVLGVVLSWTAIAAGCNDQEPARSSQPLEAQVSAPASLVAGQAIALTLTVSNPSAESVTLYVGVQDTSSFEPVVRDTQGRIVWTSAAGTYSDAMLRPLHFAPGETRTLHATWDGRNPAGVLLPAGSYLLTGTIPLRRDTLVAQNSPLTIVVAP